VKTLSSEIAARLDEVKATLERTAARAGRRGSDITLVGVTKGVPLEVIQAALAQGLSALGENRIQEALPKIDALRNVPEGSGGLRWHFVGHLQTNKAGPAVGHFELIHSVDSLKLAQTISRKAAEMGKRQDCLIEVKLSPEPAKFGVEPPRIDELVEEVRNLPHIRLTGFMTIAPFVEDKRVVRDTFQRARRIFEGLRHRLEGEPVLSMGMSDDFEIAIEEGSTLVRIGCAIFGGRS
jgi:hypothetical protein